MDLTQEQIQKAREDVLKQSLKWPTLSRLVSWVKTEAGEYVAGTLWDMESGEPVLLCVSQEAQFIGFPLDLYSPRKSWAEVREFLSLP